MVSLLLTALVMSQLGAARESGTGKNMCVECGPDQYWADNSCQGCKPCTPPPRPGSRKVVTRPCTEYSDTEIGCETGAYRRDGLMGTFGCLTCTKCAHDEVEKRPCTNSHDRECENRGLRTNATSAPENPSKSTESNKTTPPKTTPPETTPPGTDPIDGDHHNSSPSSYVEIIVIIVLAVVIIVGLIVYHIYSASHPSIPHGQPLIGSGDVDGRVQIDG